MNTDPEPASVNAVDDAEACVNTGFSRNARLNTKSDYTFVFKKNRRHTDKFWTLLAHKCKADTPSRLGLAIAKKRAKRAVDRNRLKRVAREAFRHRQTQLQGYHLVVMNRDAATEASAKLLRQSLDTLLDRVAGSPANNPVSSRKSG